MTDEANVRRVAGGTVLDDLIAISAFYRWAGFRFGVSDPVARRQVPGPDAAVEELRALPAAEREYDVLDEDVARVSPLKHANLNVLGRYSFTASTPASGALRPLRDPDAPELDEDDGGQNWE